MQNTDQRYAVLAAVAQELEGQCENGKGYSYAIVPSTYNYLSRKVHWLAPRKGSSMHSYLDMDDNKHHPSRPHTYVLMRYFLHTNKCTVLEIEK
jgi:hypothetical protein